MNTSVRFWGLNEEQEIDRGVLFGAAVVTAFMAIGIASAGNVLNFLDLPSFLIVLGGTIGITFINFSQYDIRHAWSAFKGVFANEVYHPIERISYLVSLSQHVKKEGLLVLESEAQDTSDPFLRLALEATVDGQQHEDVRRILETEMRTAHERTLRAVQVFETMGNYAPAMGLIGTLIGLIQMLGALHDAATVGPAMALALVTTLYGALLANIIFLPVAGKLRNRSEEAFMVKLITIEGILSLGKQENPLILEQKLQSFLPLMGQG